jgi:ferredoxin-NADP reductase/ferredoxin
VAKICSVTINGQTFTAKAGDLLLDAALSSGVHIPHDCRSGLCGSCLTRVVCGSTILGETVTSGRIYACKARILSDLEAETDDVPETVSANGIVMELRPLAPDVMEVTIGPERRLPSLPGQYFKFKFDGYPARNYSATRPLQRRPYATSLTLQVRRFETGRVSGQLGRRIRRGHVVAITGPFGGAFFREGKTGRLVLFSSGTGFAPIWSIACAALRENPEREIVLVAGVRSSDPIYMASALERLVRFPNTDVIVTIGRRLGLSDLVRAGYPSDNIPALRPDDIVYACGPAQLIEALSPAVAESGAEFYTDAFEPAGESAGNLLEGAKRLKQLLIPEGGWSLTLPNALPGAGSQV